MIRPGNIGILPAGALGVSFFYHLTGHLADLSGGVSFIERQGSASAKMLQEVGYLQIVPDDQVCQRLSTQAIVQPDLLTCYQRGTLPEVLLVCPNPDQLLEVITACVQLLIEIHERGQLTTKNLPFPCVVLCANGIYFQRVRQFFIEKLEEGTLFGQLPDLWPELMPKIVGHLMRGVTIQTGVREGSGANTLYRPGPSGLTRLAGGDLQLRERCAQVLCAHGGWFELATDRSPTRLEFDKALLNLVCNLLGQLYAIDELGNFCLLTVGEVLVPAHAIQIKELIGHVLRVGQAVKAYPAEETIDRLYTHLITVSQPHHGHVPSSLQWVGLRLRLGILSPEVTPTESWLVDPLMRYARSAGLEDTATYFEQLKLALVEKLTCAIRHKNGL